MREITHIKVYSIGLTLFYPHNCTSWSKGMTSFLLGSKIWLSKICRVSMPSYLSLPKDPYKLFRSRKEIRQHCDMPWWGTKHIYERSERIIWGAKICLHFQNQMKTQVSELIDARGFESMLFHYSITQDNVVDTQKFIGLGEAWNNLYADYIWRRWPILVPWTLLEDEQRAKCGGACWRSLTHISNCQLSHKMNLYKHQT